MKALIRILIGSPGENKRRMNFILILIFSYFKVKNFIFVLICFVFSILILFILVLFYLPGHSLGCLISSSRKRGRGSD